MQKIFKTEQSRVINMLGNDVMWHYREIFKRGLDYELKRRAREFAIAIN